MSYISETKGRVSPDFLASEVGLRRETRQIPQSMAVTDGCAKYVPAGTIFPANDGTAQGILFVDVYVTDGDMPGSVMTAGKVWSDRLPTAPSTEAAAAMEKLGIVFATAPTITRP